ncbi:hypothetical protein CGQ25_11090 [Sinomonas sp. R1AF57]|nr:hypothetical protein CGQ25_11090 [Sinomonas sp. R1AF57]
MQDSEPVGERGRPAEENGPGLKSQLLCHCNGSERIEPLPYPEDVSGPDGRSHTACREMLQQLARPGTPADSSQIFSDMFHAHILPVIQGGSRPRWPCVDNSGGVKVRNCTTRTAMRPLKLHGAHELCTLEHGP